MVITLIAIFMFIFQQRSRSNSLAAWRAIVVYYHVLVGLCIFQFPLFDLEELKSWPSFHLIEVIIRSLKNKDHPRFILQIQSEQY
jgi:hypothetical protein